MEHQLEQRCPEHAEKCQVKYGSGWGTARFLNLQVSKPGSVNTYKIHKPTNTVLKLITFSG